jgi:hypothetical protein
LVGKASVVAAVVALLIVPAAASAQSPLQSDSWLVSGGIGLALDPDADPSLTFLASAAFPITSIVAIEGELAHVVDMEPGDGDVDSSLTTVHASALYFFETDYELTPYLAAGLGLGKFSHEVRIPAALFKRDATEVGFNLGAGATYPVGDSAFVRGDFRYFKHIDDVPSVWRFTAGVSVRLGR